MKIALVSAQILKTPPKDYGGLELVVYDLGVALAKAGHDITVFAPKGSRCEGAKVVELGDATETVNVDWNALEEKAWTIYHPMLKDFDIIHDHSWFGWPYISKWRSAQELRAVTQKDGGTSISAAKKLSVCHTHHGMVGWRSLPPKEAMPMNMMGISKWHALHLSEGLGIPTRYCYNGINNESYEYSTDKEDWYLFLSRIDRIKGPHLAIQAAKQAGVKLKVAGGSFVQDKNYIKTVKEMCDGEQIEFIGDVTHEQKKVLLSSAKAVLYAPVWPFQEPFGLVPIEAAASGTPTISLINGATPETVGPNGVLCPSVDGMVEAIRENLVADATPVACLEWAKNFSRENMAQNYLALYREIVEGREW